MLCFFLRILLLNINEKKEEIIDFNEKKNLLKKEKKKDSWFCVVVDTY